jgi:hypothetical protein
MAENYRIGAMQYSKLDDQTLAGECLNTGYKYLEEAEKKIEMGGNQEEQRYQVSLERLFLEEADILIKSKSRVIKKAHTNNSFQGLLAKALRTHSALNNYPNLRTRAQNLVDLLKEDLK